MATRFTDPLIWIYSLAADGIYVVCPRCSGPAVSAPRPVDGRMVQYWPRRLACPGCGYSAAWEPGDHSEVPGQPRDPFFGLPLWLQAECCGGHTLWAFNGRHLDLLEAYVGATMRERGRIPGTMSMIERLPAWIKVAKNRDEILRTIKKLLATSPGSR